MCRSYKNVAGKMMDTNIRSLYLDILKYQCRIWIVSGQACIKNFHYTLRHLPGDADSEWYFNWLYDIANK